MNPPAVVQRTNSSPFMSKRLWAPPAAMLADPAPKIPGRRACLA